MMVLSCRGMDEESGSEGGDGSVQFEGSLEPINWGNFYDMKRASQLFKLVGCATRLCPRLIAFDKTNHLCFILPVVLTLAVQKKEACAPIGGWEGREAESLVVPSL